MNYTAQQLSKMTKEEFEAVLDEHTQANGPKSALIEESKIDDLYAPSWAIKPNDPNSQGSLIMNEVLNRNEAFSRKDRKP